MATVGPIAINIQPPCDVSDGETSTSVLTSPSLNALIDSETNRNDNHKRHSFGGNTSEYMSDENLSSKPKLSQWKLYKLKDELEHIYSKFRYSGKKLNRQLSQLRRRRSSSADRRSKQIKVEYVDSDVIKDPDSDSIGDEDTLELPDHNYSPSLSLTDLRDGCFNAQLPLNALPSGEITIRIRNYKMEVIVGRRSSLVDDKHCISCPMRYGDIDIPIYVNPATLNFELDDKSGILYVSGLTKGCTRTLSMPGGDLRPESRENSWDRLPRLSRSKSCNRSQRGSKGKGSPRRSLTVSHPPNESFRRRARTH